MTVLTANDVLKFKLPPHQTVIPRLEGQIQRLPSNKCDGS